jgi:hypothetical protein
MFRINTSGITSTSAMPLKKGTIDHLQTSILSGDVSLIRSQIGASYLATNIYVVYGLDRTVSGSVHTFTDGVVLYNNQLYAIVGSSITLTSGNYINLNLVNSFLTTSGYDPTQFSDGAFKNIHELNAGNLTQSATSSNESNTWIYLNKVYKVTNPLTYGSPVLNANYSGTLNFSLKNQVLTVSGTIVGLTSAVSGDILFTLPVGFRPSASIIFICSNNSLYPEKFGNIIVANNGQVTINTMVGDPTSLNNRIVSFANSLHI